MSSTNILRLLAQFVAIPILARLLSPSDYGVVAIAMPFVLFAMMLADAGIGMSLVRTPSSERVEWSTCFWLSLMLGACLAVLMIGVAPLAAYVFGVPELKAIVMALGLIVFAQSMSAIPGARLQQSQRYQAIAIAEVAAIVVGIGTAVIVAVKGGGAWALVGQQLAYYAVRVSLTCWLSKFIPLIVFDLQSVSEHLWFSRDVLSVNILGFINRSADNLVIGKALSAASVGIYSMAFQFARIPTMLVTGPLQFVLYGQLASAQSDKTVIRATFLVLTQLLAVAIFPSMGMVAAAYKPVFALLLSTKWAASGYLFMLVSAACSLQAVTALCGTIMLVLGRAEIRLRTTVEFGVIWIVVLLVSIRFGLEAAAMMYNITVILYVPRTLGLVLPLIECAVSAYARAILIPVGITALCIASYELIQRCVAMGDVSLLVMGGMLATLGVVSSGLLQRRAIITEMALWRLSNRHTGATGKIGV